MSEYLQHKAEKLADKGLQGSSYQSSYRTAINFAVRFAESEIQAERSRIADELLWVRAGATNFIELSENIGKYVEKLRGINARQD